MNYLYLIFAVAHLAVGSLVIQATAKQKSLGLWLLTLVNVGFAYANTILGIGELIGAGDTLWQLNVVRFAIHAIATPLMMIAGLTLARNASVNETWRRSMTILVYVTTLSYIVYGVNEYITGAVCKIADSGMMRYVLAESICKHHLFDALLCTCSSQLVLLWGPTLTRQYPYHPRLYRLRRIYLYDGNQSLIGMEPIHMITYVINWACIAAHIVLSFRFMVQRVSRANVDPMCELTVSLHLREPIAK